MTSQDILKSWDKSKEVFGYSPLAFFSLHRICSAGPSGTNLNKLNRVAGYPTKATFDRWIAGGLVTRTLGRSATNRLTVTYHATAKAYQLLRVEVPAHLKPQE
jgi:hypothetical protein